ncbi:uncharacterized protein [Argopecten irradians]|uniref:uncharacterized protein n=1 Tax=Argopecten irradians TaxID=31199 RepID=UPI0037168E9A
MTTPTLEQSLLRRDSDRSCEDNNGEYLPVIDIAAGVRGTPPTIDTTLDCIIENGGRRVTDAGYEKFCQESAAEPYVNLTYSKFPRRMETFGNKSNFRGIARAGFYKIDRGLVCCCCRFEPRFEAGTTYQEAIKEHIMWFRHCRFVKQKEHEQVRISVQQEMDAMEQSSPGIHPRRRTTLHTDDIIDLFDNGYQKSKIMSAVINYFMRNGAFPNVEHLRREINGEDG